MKALANRLADYKAGQPVKPFTTPDYSSRWGGKPFAIGANVGYWNTFGRWHESPETPCRFVGLAHKIVRLDHTGWFTIDECADELAHGVVYLLPHGRFLACIADPCQSNKDGTGPAIVETDRNGNPCIYEDKEEAARAADQFAELYAEAERAYQEQERKRTALEESIAGAENELTELRGDTRQLIAGIRESQLSPSLCARMRAEVVKLRGKMKAAFWVIRNAHAELSTLEG